MWSTSSRGALDSETERSSTCACQVGVKEGVVLLTYSSLISAADSGASRLQQLVDWCKPNFEGLIVFDGMPCSVSTATLGTVLWA